MIVKGSECKSVLAVVDVQMLFELSLLGKYVGWDMDNIAGSFAHN